MVQKFYEIHQHPLYWFSSRKNISRANEWLNVIDVSENYGFVTEKIQFDEFRSKLKNKNLNDTIKEQTDRQITGIVLNYIKDLQQGNINFGYDEVSISRDSIYINQILYSEGKELVSSIVSKLDCKDPEYVVLKNFLHDSLTEKEPNKYNMILLAMNYRRYLATNHQSEYVLVNIPEAEAEYYRNDSLLIKMRTIMGTKLNPTPVFASYITSIITFPYWYVPVSIAENEILPKVQKDEIYLEQNNFDVVDAHGNIIEDSLLRWNDYDENNFPYFFRQSTGANNALGVLKFELQNPFYIFLHATSQPAYFSKDYRFLSHGCIRLEKPFELAEALLRGKLNIEELKSGEKNSLSTVIQLPQKIPAFIIYMPVKVVGENVTFLQDVYGQIK